MVFVATVHALSQLRLDRSESVMDDIKRTANALSFQVTSAQRSRTPSGMVGAPTYFNYTKPSAQNASSRSRVIKLQEAAADPLEPPRHHLRKVSTCYQASYVTFHRIIVQLPPERVQSTGTLLHSPPRSLTDSEREEWDIPPSISNWKVRCSQPFHAYIDKTRARIRKATRYRWTSASPRTGEDCKQH